MPRLANRNRLICKRNRWRTFWMLWPAATPNPAGGTVAALVGALAASLGIMGARLSQQRGVEHRLSEIGRRLRELMQADGDAYQRFIRATRLAKTDRTRPAVLSSALHLATEIPLEIAEQATEAGALLHACSAEVKPARPV